MESIILWLFRANFVSPSGMSLTQRLASHLDTYIRSSSRDDSFLEFPKFQVCTETRREERLSRHRMLHCANSYDNPEEDTGHG